LDEKYKEVLDLIYLKGYSHVEAAQLLTLPVGTVKTRLRFGVNALRKKLKNEKGFFEGLLMLLLLILMQLL
jgi:DNA-directed RNA polymerase specialized sigma24 family protein